MLTRLAIGVLVLIAAVVLLQGVIFGDDDGDGGSPSSARPGSIPTATVPANLPEPILVQSSGSSGSTSGGVQAGEETYTVESGDSLAAIAIKLGIPAEQQTAWIADVLRLNNIPDARLLKAGDVLSLPRASSATTRTTGTPAATGTVRTTTTPARTGTPAAGTTPASGTATPRATASSGSSGRTYTVVSGDNPLVIAEKLCVASATRSAWANELISLNSLDPAKMAIGQVLNLPPNTPASC